MRDNQLHVAYIHTYIHAPACTLCVVVMHVWMCVPIHALPLQMAGLKLKLEDAEQLNQECKVGHTEMCQCLKKDPPVIRPNPDCILVVGFALLF